MFGVCGIGMLFSVMCGVVLFLDVIFKECVHNEGAAFILSMVRVDPHDQVTLSTKYTKGHLLLLPHVCEVKTGVKQLVHVHPSVYLISL